MRLPLGTSIVLSLVLALAPPIAAQEGLPEDPEASPDPAVHADAAARRITFEGEIIQNQGLLEACLCGPNGRTHESLLVATVPPAAFLEAIESLGLATAETWARNERDLFAVQGDKVLLWVDFGDGRRVLVEDLIQNDFEKTPMRRRGWTVHAKRFERELPEEMEFSLTFKGLRGAALSTLDSPFAYRPFVHATLIARQEALPPLETADGHRLHPRVVLVLEPTDEETITRLALGQKGAPPAADPAPFLAAARRLDQLKKAYATDVRPLLARQEDPRAAARIDVAVLEIEAASYELEILHERRELASIEAAPQSDEWTLGYKRDALGLFEVCRDIAAQELEGARAALGAIELAATGNADPDQVRRLELTRDAHRARARAITKKPDLADAKFQLERASEEMKAHFGRLVEVVSAEVRLAEKEAEKAETERERIGAAPAAVPALVAALAEIETEIEASRAVVRLYELERELGKLRRDLRFYESDGIDDEEKAAEIRARIQELEATISSLKTK